MAVAVGHNDMSRWPQACEGLQGCTELAQQLPWYEDLAGAPAPAATPVWLADSILAARMQFLMPFAPLFDLGYQNGDTTGETSGLQGHRVCRFRREG